MIGYRMGDMYSPKLDMTEALFVEAKHFLDCIENHTLPITGGEVGKRVVQILEAAAKSMKSRGKSIQI